MKWEIVENDLPEPGVMVIAYFKNEYGKHRRIRAMYALKRGWSMQALAIKRGYVCQEGR